MLVRAGRPRDHCRRISTPWLAGARVPGAHGADARHHLRAGAEGACRTCHGTTEAAFAHRCTSCRVRVDLPLPSSALLRTLSSGERAHACESCTAERPVVGGSRRWTRASAGTAGARGQGLTAPPQPGDRNSAVRAATALDRGGCPPPGAWRERMARMFNVAPTAGALQVASEVGSARLERTAELPDHHVRCLC
jgi:hypothetical protein